MEEAAIFGHTRRWERGGAGGGRISALSFPWLMRKHKHDTDFKDKFKKHLSAIICQVSYSVDIIKSPYPKSEG